MRLTLASPIMRTTGDIGDPILKEVKRPQQRDGKSLGRPVPDLLAQSLAATRATANAEVPAIQWVAQAEGERLDLADKTASRNAMDGCGARSLASTQTFFCMRRIRQAHFTLERRSFFRSARIGAIFFAWPGSRQ